MAKCANQSRSKLQKPMFQRLFSMFINTILYGNFYQFREKKRQYCIILEDNVLSLILFSNTYFADYLVSNRSTEFIGHTFDVPHWFTVDLSYYGISMNLPPLSTNEYVSFILVSLFEFLSYIFMYFTLNVFGRKLVLMFGLLLAGIMTICAASIPADSGNSWIALVLILLGKFGSSTSFGVTIVYTSEIFPTVVRSPCYGLCMMIGHIGSILAPYLSVLALYYYSLPLLVFGIFSLLSLCLAFYIPETLDHPLLDTLEESEEFIKKNRFDIRKMLQLLLRNEITHL